jgi:hypothetical protein
MLRLLLAGAVALALPHQQPLAPPPTPPPQYAAFNITLDSPAAPVPRVYYQARADPPDGLELHPLAVSGEAGERVNLAIFADGCE